MFLISFCLLSFYFLFLLSLFSFLGGLYLINYDLVIFLEWNLVDLNSTLVSFVLVFDWMSLFFMFLVSFISSFVILYSRSYMHMDLSLNRFIILILLFVFSMLCLIMSPNLISLLLGWDGLGLVSYLLVIYYQNIKSFNAGMLTALSNRVGDVAILMSIAWFLNFGSWNYLFYLNNDSFEMSLIGIFIILAGMTKSAQIPFSAWLPAAMAAPTPVSALVHSSTLVTAGVYLLIRFNLLLESSNLGLFLLLIGCLTMFMAGLAANFENDLKKIIALSTLSQLGLMMGILSMGMYKLAFFHLLTHALFKALLFMCAGVLIHQMFNNQDIRLMGAFIQFMPLVGSFFLVSNLALCGLPFMSGFYSKDLILEWIYFSSTNLLIFFFFVFSTGLTVCYSFRLFYYSLNRQFSLYSMFMILDNFNYMIMSMFGLMFMSILGGSFFIWILFPVPVFIFLSLGLKLMTLLVCFLGGAVGYFMFYFGGFKFFKNLGKVLKIKSFLSNMWFMPYLCSYGVIGQSLKLGYKSLFMMDQGWSEVFGGQIIYYFFFSYSSYLEKFYFNNLSIYLLFFLFWLIIMFMMNFILNKI